VGENASAGALKPSTSRQRVCPSARSVYSGKSEVRASRSRRSVRAWQA
jgi:hypothetical protein